MSLFVSPRIEVDSLSQRQQNPLHAGISPEIPIRSSFSPKLTHRRFDAASNRSIRATPPSSSIWLAWSSSNTTSQRVFSFSAMPFCTSSMSGSSESNFPIFSSSQTGNWKLFFSVKTSSRDRSAQVGSGRSSSTSCTSIGSISRLSVECSVRKKRCGTSGSLCTTWPNPASCGAKERGSFWIPRLRTSVCKTRESL